MRRARRFALLGAAPLLALGLALALGLGRDAKTACELEEYAEQRGGHLAVLPTGFVYNSFPPTSGPSADRPLVWNEYGKPISQFRLMHNLLHGGLAAQYGKDVPRKIVDDLRAWYRRDSAGVVVAPLPRLGDRIVLTAWRNAARCRGFRERAFTAFRSAHRFNGPERPPPETMQRGRGGAPNPLGLRVTPSPVRERATLSFLYARAATVVVEIRSGTASGRRVRQLARLSTLPNVRVDLTWDRRDDLGRPVASGIYVAVANLVAGEVQTTSTSVFEVR